jgi:hypothetical protein
MLASETGFLISAETFGGGHAETRGVPACLPRHCQLHPSFPPRAKNLTAQRQKIKASKMSCKHVDAAGRSNHLLRKDPLLWFLRNHRVLEKARAISTGSDPGLLVSAWTTPSIYHGGDHPDMLAVIMNDTKANITTRFAPSWPRPVSLPGGLHSML